MKVCKDNRIVACLASILSSKGIQSWERKMTVEEENGKKVLACMDCASWMANKWPEWKFLGVETLSKLGVLKRMQKV